MHSHPLTYAEKMLGAKAGSIVFKMPDIVLSHDNTVSIQALFRRMGGVVPRYPERLMFVLDHNAPPSTTALANDYNTIRKLAVEYGVDRFFNAGEGICHQLMTAEARPGMFIVGSDSHTCTAGALNTFAVGIDRTETAGIWLTGETWFRVPESFRVTLEGSLREGVSAKDLALWISGMLGAEGVSYMSLEFHGAGVGTLSVSDRLVLANMASELGAKNAVFPCDKVLCDYLGESIEGNWSDPGATYAGELTIRLNEVFPVAAIPHNTDRIRAIAEIDGTPVHQALIGTCSNGRIEDLREAARYLRGKRVHPEVQMNVIPASRQVYLEAVKEGLAEIFIGAGANMLSPSCGPCLGTGQGIPADRQTVISTANRNFKGRMGNPNASIFLASPATVACSAIHGKITDPREGDHAEQFPVSRQAAETSPITISDDRYAEGVWDYSDVHNLNTDQMFAGNLTYTIKSSEPDLVLPHLFAGFDPGFASRVSRGDILVAGNNFGCGSSREHPSVGLAHAGVNAILCKSVNRIFFRSAINQGLLIITNTAAVDSYRRGDRITIDCQSGYLSIGDRQFFIDPLPEKLQQILAKGGLAKYYRSE